MSTKIIVVDAIMGTGKTRFCIDLIHSRDYERMFEDGPSFLYIAPRIEDYQEVQRRGAELHYGFSLREPEQVDGKKMTHLLELMAAGENIASTHELFKRVDQEMLDVLAEHPYVLIVDEETEWVHEYAIRKDDARGLFEAQYVYVDSKQRIRWNYEKWPRYDGDKWADVKRLADNGNLVYVDDTFLVWEMPTVFLEAFEHIYICTYLFEGSVLSAYLRANDMPYEVKTLDATCSLVDMDGGLARRRKQELARLVAVYEADSLNTIGTPRHRENPLSATWFDIGSKRDPGRLKTLKDATYNFFFNHAKGKSKENMWATFKSHSAALKGKGYARGFTPVNLKATNEHRHKKNLAYLANIFMRPRLVQYFEECGVVPDQDLYAVSQLVQWVWRSRIRDGKSINLYLPAERMRHLFKAWLADEFHPRLRLVEVDKIEASVA